MSENLMAGLLSEIERVDNIIKEYLDPSLGGAGFISATLMEYDIDKAKKSIQNDDALEMIESYIKLKEWEL